MFFSLQSSKASDVQPRMLPKRNRCGAVGDVVAALFGRGRAGGRPGRALHRVFDRPRLAERRSGRRGRVLGWVGRESFCLAECDDLVTQCILAADVHVHHDVPAP